MLTKSERLKISVKFADLRMEKKWSINMAAKRLGVSGSYLCKIEHRQRFPSEDICNKMMVILYRGLKEI